MHLKKVDFYTFSADRNAGAVIHTHSKAAVMVTLLYPGPVFRITHQEMIKVSFLGNETALALRGLLDLKRACPSGGRWGKVLADMAGRWLSTSQSNGRGVDWALAIEMVTNLESKYNFRYCTVRRNVSLRMDT